MTERIGDRWPLVAAGLIGVGLILGWTAHVAWLRERARERVRKVIFTRGTWWLRLGGSRREQAKALDRARHLEEVPD